VLIRASFVKYITRKSLCESRIYAALIIGIGGKVIALNLNRKMAEM